MTHSTPRSIGRTHISDYLHSSWHLIAALARLLMATIRLQLVLRTSRHAREALHTDLGPCPIRISEAQAEIFVTELRRKHPAP